MTYREATWNMRRVFTMHPDQIEVHLKSQHLDAHSTVRLADLQTEVERIRIRPMVPFRLGMLFLIIGLVGLIVSLLRPDLNSTYPFGAYSSSFLVGALPILALFARKIDYARFKSLAGIIVLDVGRSGPDKIHYDAFVEELIHRILSLKRNVNEPTVSS